MDSAERLMSERKPPASSGKKTLVQMRLAQQTIDRVRTIQERAHLGTKVEAVRLAIDLAFVIIRAMRDKDTRILIDRDGKLEVLVIPQLD